MVVASHNDVANAFHGAGTEVASLSEFCFDGASRHGSVAEFLNENI